MNRIMTVLGPFGADEIGHTSTHEHLFATATSNRFDPDTELDDLDMAVEELLSFRDSGGDTIVEVTTIDMGRDVTRLATVSISTGVKIVAATGFYKGNYDPKGGKPAHRWSFLPEELDTAGVESLAALFIQEIREGIAGTGIRAGIIGEIGVSYHCIEEKEERVLRAAGRASRITGAPISVHTTLGTMGREIIEILCEEKADLSRVVLCHLDLQSDVRYLVDLARQGVFLGFDTVGKERYQSDARRVELIKELVDRGFDEQIVLASDVGRRSQLRCNGGEGYSYLFNRFVPRLEAAGLGSETVRRFLVENPRRLLSF